MKLGCITCEVWWWSTDDLNCWSCGQAGETDVTFTLIVPPDEPRNLLLPNR